MPQPIIATGTEGGQINASGNSFEIHAGVVVAPTTFMSHYADDETWHVLEGTLTFPIR